MSTQTKLIFSAFIFTFALLMPAKGVTPVPGYIYTYDASGCRTTRTYSAAFILGNNKIGDTTETKVGSYSESIFPNPTRGLLKMYIADLP